MGVTIVRPAWVYGPGDPRTERILPRRRPKPIHSVRTAAGTIATRSTSTTTSRAWHGCCCSRTPSRAPTSWPGRRYLTSRELIGAAERVTGGKTRLRVPLAMGYAAGLGAELACRVVGASPPISRRTLAFFTNQNAFDTTRARNEFGFAPSVDTVEGFQRVWRSMRQPAEPARH